jgi:tripartite-type tricarboxylate transporter receptor subunit TctC
MINRRRFTGLAAASLFAPTCIGGRALAQSWPTRFVRIIVPFPPGAPPDVVGRLLAARLSEVWGQQIVVENKPGAGGNIGTEAVARSAPDGHTILMAAFPPHAANFFLYRSRGYDPIADFAPVTRLSLQPCVMMVPNSSPAHSVKEFIAHAKTNTGKITFASAGHGTGPHLAGELFKRMTGIEMMHVPYRTGAQQDLIAGRVDLFFAVAGSGFTMMRAGQARALAVTGTKRVAAVPDLPTVAEAGVPGFDVSTWWALFVPAKTAQAVIRKIHDDTVAVLADAGIRKRLEDLGVTPVGSTPEELASDLRAEMEKWGPVIREAKITISE